MSKAVRKAKVNAELGEANGEGEPAKKKAKKAAKSAKSGQKPCQAVSKKKQMQLELQDHIAAVEPPVFPMDRTKGKSTVDALISERA